MLTDSDRDIAEKLKERLLAYDGARIRRVILYGSRARAAARPESDFDLLVVEKDPVQRIEETRRLHEAVKGLPVPVHVWVMGEVEFQETKDVIGGLAYPAHRYGVVLHENP